MSNRFLLQKFANWRQSEDILVLATVVDTKGSTYSKAGRHILIRQDGRHEGLLSGGCLEGDLAEQARMVFANQQPQIVTYDMRDTADDLWGIGLGCNGMMQILLQPLQSAENWQPFATLATAMEASTPFRCSMVVESSSAELPVGTCRLSVEHTAGRTQPSAPPDEAVMALPPTKLPALVAVESPEGPYTVMHWRVSPWPRVLLLGAGPDAVPVTKLAATLGWEISVADHREHYIKSADFPTASQARNIEPEHLAQELDLQSYSAIVVMSHHLDTDRIYLEKLAAADIDPKVYLGVLGPAARRTKLLNELQLQTSTFAEQLRGPVGLDIGSDSPETIALSLIAEIQAHGQRTRQ